MVDTLPFPGIFFCLCGRLEAVLRAAMGIWTCNSILGGFDSNILFIVFLVHLKYFQLCPQMYAYIFPTPLE